MTGETTHNLRGDYAGMRPDYTVDQAWSAYSPEEHALWRRLGLHRLRTLARHGGADNAVIDRHDLLRIVGRIWIEPTARGNALRDSGRRIATRRRGGHRGRGTSRRGRGSSGGARQAAHPELLRELPRLLAL